MHGLSYFIFFFFYSFLSQPATSGQSNDDEFRWPNGAKAALCLTYDDGLPSHINIAGPMLNKYNFKGTFFLTLSAPSIRNEINKWKKLAQEGHELANHTLYHPCRKSEPGMEWVEDHHDLDKYTVRQILEEIQTANSFLKALDGKTSRTFAYPCAHYHAGGISFKDSISNYATAARDASETRTKLPAVNEIDIFLVPSWAPSGHEGKDLIAYIKNIIGHETLSTFTFHGVGADHMSISEEAHEEMLKYLDRHRNEIWVATFQEATDYLRSKRQRN